MFESVNGQMNGRWLESHTISSLRAFGSGELQTCEPTLKFSDLLPETHLFFYFALWRDILIMDNLLPNSYTYLPGIK